MRKGSDSKRDRRELFRSLGRCALLAGLGVVAALTGRGKSPGAREGVACYDPGLCRRCDQLSGCTLPAARKALQGIRGKGRS